VAALPAELARAHDIILRHGWNSTVFQILNPGIDLWFSDAEDALVGYVEHAGVRVVAGAPVAAGDRLASVTREFEADTARRGLSVCYFGAERRLERLLQVLPGHATVVLGAQPTWDPRSWVDIVATHASLRGQLNRALNKGVAVSEWDAQRAGASPALRGCLQAWLATRGLPPLHFLVEPATLGRILQRRVFVAERHGDVVGFLLASPIPTRGGWLIEQVIRAGGAPNGTNELLIDAAMRALARSGSAYVTLGLAPLARREGLPRTLNPRWLRVLLHWVRAHGQRFYNFEGLEFFKEKLRPQEWEPVFAVSNERRFSPRTLYAIAAAFSDGPPFRTVAAGLASALERELAGLGRRLPRPVAGVPARPARLPADPGADS
jgi:phosphatidylglycerol lysyltransferase